MAGLQGRTLGGYQLTEQIASAGIAEVYRARPLASNGREVVIKVIYPEFARYPSFLPNFQQIIQTAKRLASHPHILPVVASGEENGYLFLATPWVADGTLRDWIGKGGRLGTSDAGPFFHQLCSALAYAHSLGLVHGNLKPSNVFLYEGRHVMLGDFGMLWDIRQLDMNHSGSGVDVVEYLAPESFAGQFTQQSDIYSLGAVLFATLAGRPPFSGSKPADLRDAHAQYPPPRLGQVDPSLPPAIQALDPIIQQAMAKRPEDRFPSAMAMAQAVETTLQQQSAATPMGAMGAAPALPGSRMPYQQPVQPMMPQTGWPQQGGAQPAAPHSWAAPGPIQPAAPVGGVPALPPPAGAAMQPLDPPFPPLQSPRQPEPPLSQGWPAEPPLAQGWPAAPVSSPAPQQPTSEGVQYTERVPAPPVARPLLSRPQLKAPESAMPTPSAPVMPGGDDWGEPYLPAGGDDPEWKPNAWPATPQSPRSYDDGLARAADGHSRRQAARDDDWRIERNPASRGSQSRYSQNDFPSEYTDERVAIPESSHSLSREDWAGLSQSGPHSEALRYRGGFSATELGLPRLTNPALQGELPPEWEDLLADEKLPRRADVGSGVPRRQAPSRRNPPDSYAYSSVGQPYEPNRPPTRSASRGMQGDRGSDDFGQPAAARAGRQQRAQPMPTLASAHMAAFTANRMPASSEAAPQAKRERGSISGRRRWPFLVLLLVAAVMVVGSTGVVLAKPTACPGSICTQANSFLHRHLSFLGPAPNANVLQATPSNLSVQAVAGSSTNLNVQVSNSGTDSAVWHASASVGWLSVSPRSGTLPAGSTMTLTVAASPTDVPPGNYTAELTVETVATSIKIPVTAAIAMGPKLGLSATSLNVTQCGVAQTFKVNNTGDKPLSYTATAAKATAVTLTGASGTVNPGGSATISFTMNCSAFFADYTISVASNGGNGTMTIHYT